MDTPIGLGLSLFIRGQPFILKGRRHIIIKSCLKTLVDAQVIPIGRRIVIRRIDSFKPIIINNVELRGDSSSSKVANQADILSVKSSHYWGLCASGD